MNILYDLLFILSATMQMTAENYNNKDSGTTPVECITKEGFGGFCISADLCNQITKTRFHNNRNACFYQDDKPFVCCPIKSEEFDTKLETSKPTKSIFKSAGLPNTMVNTSESTKDQTTTNRPEISTVENRFYEQNSKIQINPPECGKRPNVPVQGSDFIVGGKETEKYSWPWMAAIRVRIYGGNTQFLCGGSLITRKHILTAAHCFGERSELRPLSQYIIILGSHYSGDISENGVTEVTPSSIVIHEDYLSNAHDYDVAVIVLSTNINFSKRVLPVCLPTRYRSNQNPKNVTVLGWGDLKFYGSRSTTLQEASFEVIPHNKCKNIFRNVAGVNNGRGITTNMLCAGDLRGGKDACEKDSGGPLLEYVKSENKYYQVGIVSFGYRCAEKGFPGVYTKVSNFVSWIRGQVFRSS